MKSLIPIFPIKLVVFPLSKYPLHIFEKRYKKMVNTCLEENTGFGITANIGSEISKVGTYVIISEVVKKYLTGEMDIIVEGKKRFYMQSYEMHTDGYYVATVKEYKDKPNAPDEELIEQMQERFERIIDKVNYKLENSFWDNYYKSKIKSFKLAEKSGLSIEQQQTLLTFQQENERITFLIAHFEKLDEMLTENAALKQIIIGDGYLN